MAVMDKLWLGWVPRESGSAGFRCVHGDSGKAYGKYQFDYRYGLIPFMQYCISHVPDRYDSFQKFIDYGAGNQILVNNKELASLWLSYCEKYPEEFELLQDTCGYQQYYLPVKAKIKEIAKMDLNEHSFALKGSAFSMSIRSGPETAAKKYASFLINANSSDADIIKTTYASYGNSDDGRWTASQQMGDALTALEKNTYTEIVDEYDASILQAVRNFEASRNQNQVVTPEESQIKEEPIEEKPIEEPLPEDLVEEPIKEEEKKEEPKVRYVVAYDRKKNKYRNQLQAFYSNSEAVAFATKEAENRKRNINVYNDFTKACVYTARYTPPKVEEPAVEEVEEEVKTPEPVVETKSETKEEMVNPIKQEEDAPVTGASLMPSDPEPVPVKEEVKEESLPGTTMSSPGSAYKVGTGWSEEGIVGFMSKFYDLKVAKKSADAAMRTFRKSYYVYENDGDIVYEAIYHCTKDHWYRVGTRWVDGKCVNQDNAYENTQLAFKRADTLVTETGINYYVFDPTGNVVYIGKAIEEDDVK